MKDKSFKKEPKHKLNFPLVFRLAKNEARKETRYIKEDYLTELKEEKEVTMNIRSLNNMSKSLPYAVTVLKAMADKAGLTIEQIIEEKQK